MPMKMKNMRGIDIFCASPASTAVSSSPKPKPKPFLSHHNHHQTFSNNNLYTNHRHSSAMSSRLAAAPCISELPFTPRRRKSSADVSDLRHESSSRYLLLRDSSFFDSNLSSSSSSFEPEKVVRRSSSIPSNSNKCLALVPSTPVLRSEERELTRSRSGAPSLGSFIVDAKKTSPNFDDGGGHIVRHNSMAMVKSSVSSPDQVVVLKVSLHCKGCEGKLKKHLSKMEGVTSFRIDMETKKVTVVGNVSPQSLLTSISKVKYAQLWPSPTSTSSSSSSSSSSSLSSASSKSDFNY